MVPRVAFSVAALNLSLFHVWACPYHKDSLENIKGAIPQFPLQLVG